MSGQHTQGRIEAFTEPEFSGWWALREKTDDGLNHEVGSGDGGLFEPDARRLAAAWNACEGMPIEHIEALEGIGTMGDLSAMATGELVDMRKELAAARALLREVLDEDGASLDTESRIRSYLDATDTPGGEG